MCEAAQPGSQSPGHPTSLCRSPTSVTALGGVDADPPATISNPLASAAASAAIPFTLISPDLPRLSAAHAERHDGGARRTTVQAACDCDDLDALVALELRRIDEAAERRRRVHVEPLPCAGGALHHERDADR